MKRQEIGSLTGLRGFAALWVVLFHLQFAINDWSPAAAHWIWNFAGAGYLGVDLFFVLSGFVLAYNYPGVAAGVAYRGFLVKRLARIYPIHVTLIAVLAFIAWCLPIIDMGDLDFATLGFGDLVKNLTLTHAWFGDNGFSWNFVSWSISAEWAAYLAFPLVLLFATYVRRVSIAIVIIAAAYSGLHGATSQTDVYQISLVRVGIEFTCGVLVYRIATMRPLRDGGLICAFCALALLLGGRWLEARHKDEAMNWLPILMPLLIYALTGSNFASKLLATDACRYLGRISYSLYMVHGIVIFTAAQILKHLALSARQNAEILSVVTLAGSLLLASALYHFVEEPMRIRLSKRRPAPIPGTVSPV